MDFQINYKGFIRGLLPWFSRKGKQLDYINSIIKPFQDVNDSLFDYRNKMAFKLAFSAQIIYLEKYLNIVYSNPTSGIYIEDGANIVYTYVWNFAELQSPLYLKNFSEGGSPVYFENMSELINGQYSYIINVPTYCLTANDNEGVLFNENIFKKRVNFYNNAGKSYNIVYF